MAGAGGPGGDPDLAGLLAAWSARWGGRAVFQAAAGPHWLDLRLEGPERPAILLTTLPGAAMVLARCGPLPDPLLRALPAVRDHPLRRLLAGCRLVACAALSPDRAACLRLTTGAGADLYLLHKMFGAQGALSLLDAQAKALWASQRPPHPLLAAIPPASVWTEAAEPPAAAAQGQEPQSEEPPGAVARLAARLAADRALRLQVSLGRQQRTADRLVQNLHADLQNADRGESYRRSAEALAAGLHQVRQGQDVFRTTDPRDGAPLAIALDPARSPAANLDAWFRKAGKAERGRRVIAERLHEAQAQARRLQEAAGHMQALDAAARPGGDPVTALQAVLDWQDAHPQAAPAAGSRQRAERAGGPPPEPLRPFRRYRIEGRWEVWVGRSNQENDELTHRAAAPRDLWLHAQGVPGSHVVLRTGGRPEQVPRRVLEKAAALAALHSKARHSGLVPVVWTERRYVRKPRKAAPGIAVCQREKTLFVAPEVSEGVAADEREDQSA